MEKINLFCGSNMTEKKAEEYVSKLEKNTPSGCPLVVARGPWDCIRYTNCKIHHLYINYQFDADMSGDVYTCEAVLRSLLEKKNYPSGTITVGVPRDLKLSEKEKSELKELISEFHNKGIDTASD